MPHRLSFSGLGLSYHCGYSFREDVVYERKPVGRAAQLGTMVHSLVEAAVEGRSLVQDGPLASDALAVFNGPLKNYIESTRWDLCEVGLRYDADNDVCQDGPRRGERGYEGVAPLELPGTIDLVQINGDEALVVDLKTGKPPKDSVQLYAQAVAVTRRYGLKTARVQYARALKTKLEILNDEFLDPDRLDEEAGRIRHRLRTLPTSEPTPGEHCFICSYRDNCSEKQRVFGEERT